MVNFNGNLIPQEEAKLSITNRYRVSGIDILEAYEDPIERRRKLVRLTPKGKRVWKSLQDLVKS